MRMFDWNEPIERSAFQRAALPWLVVPFVLPPLIALIGTALTDGPVTDPRQLVLWLPIILARLGLVIFSMRRLLDLGVMRLVAWLALFAGGGLALYIVLAIVPAPAPTVHRGA